MNRICSAALPWLTGALCLLMLAPLLPAQAQRSVSDEDVERAIGEAVRFLYSMQEPNGKFREEWKVPTGGAEAIGLLALLEAGENPQDPRIKAGLDQLVAVHTDNTYVIAVRTMVLSQLLARDKRSAYLPQLRDDVAFLTQNLGREGAWGYHGPERAGDNSVSQYALMALWEADRAGVELSTAALKAIEQTWIKRQQKDGGWTYLGVNVVPADSTLTMTTAGLASLFICQDVLQLTCTPYAHQKTVAAGWEFLSQKLKDDYWKNGYLAFGVQRVGMASGEKLIGGKDWYTIGAAGLCAPDPKGRTYRSEKDEYGTVVQAAFELLFLSRGRIPLTFNKLRYGDERQWNVHPRDVARFTDYMWRNFETRMRWQVVDIADDLRQMLDAPILLINGTAAVSFTPEQWAKLRDYSLRGGTLLFLPTHGGDAFVNSVKKELDKLYAEPRQAAGNYYTVKPLEADHPIYSLQAKLPNGPSAAAMWGVSDGTRLLAIACSRDLAHAWQRRALGPGKLDYELGANLYLYATGQESPRTHLRPIFRPPAGEVKRTAKVAWLAHRGNWNTQPFALASLGEKLAAECRVGLDIESGVPLDAKRLAGKDLAWMTGSSEFALSDNELSQLRAYLDQGGTLFLNAVGGAESFRASAEKMLKQLLPDARPQEAAKDSPLFTGKAGDFRGPVLEKLAKTRALKQAGNRPLFLVYEHNNRPAVIYAPDGLHDTLDGHTAHAAASYLPGSALDATCNVVLTSLMSAKPKAE